MATTWSGVVVNAAAGNGITSVSGQWTIPNITPSTSGSSQCAIWVGIDGNVDNPFDLLQAGIDCVVSSGTPSFYAWWQWVPDGPHKIDGMTVSAGDEIQCSITAVTPNSATIILKNVKTGQVANILNPVKAPPQGSLMGNCAEWVVEAPLVNNIPTTLCAYGEVQFIGCTARDSHGNALDLSGGTVMDLVQKGQTVSMGSCPAPGVVDCQYKGSALSASVLSSNTIPARALPSPNAIAANTIQQSTP